jgi:hypothetical protein
MNVAIETMKRPQISKSNFIKGKQCLKALYLNKYHYELKDPISEEQQARFDRGHNIGTLAQQLFPGGKMAAYPLPRGFWKSLKFTRELIERGEPILYEAGLIYKNAHCFVDILVKENGKWKMYEVKSSGAIYETFLYDAAFQYYIAVKTGLEVDDVSLIFVNKDRLEEPEVDVQDLFIIQSVFEDVKELQAEIKQQLARETEVLVQKTIPDISTGDHCTRPYRCDFMGYCWGRVGE